MRRYLFNANQVDITVIKMPITIKDTTSKSKISQEKETSIVSRILFKAKKTVIKRHKATIADITPCMIASHR